MKNALFLLSLALISFSSLSQEVTSTDEPKKEKAQKSKKEKTKKEKKGKFKLDLTNAIVVAQMDRPEDRYSIEINMTQMLTGFGMKAMPSLNAVKIGGDPQVLVSDSIGELIKSKGIDTYCLINVRGYDRRFKVAGNQLDLSEALDIGGLFELYRADIVSISFEFKFYRDGEFVYGEVLKCGNISDRDQVLKKFRDKTEKLIEKKWRKRS